MDQPVVHHGSCHCGKVTFSILHSPNLSLSECNCSICYMKGARPPLFPFNHTIISLTLPFLPQIKRYSPTPLPGFLGLVIRADALKSLDGKEHLTEYTFNTGTAKHWFCKTCGISPLTVPRSFPEGYNINYRCLQQEHAREVKVTQRDGQHWEEEMAKSGGKYGKP